MNNFYKKHIFFCTNRRTEKNKRSCGSEEVESLRLYMKEKIKLLGVKGLRVNSSGCLNRCKKGPLMVIYPEGVWLKVTNKKDIDLIIEEHIKKDKLIKKLLIRN
jgi:(2Fe-2S) ferredoxin